jgi:hypothetical protein
MIRDVPPWIRASKASLQPLIGGAMRSLQARSSTPQEAQATIAGDGDIRAWVVIYLPSRSFSSFASINRYNLNDGPPKANLR